MEIGKSITKPEMILLAAYNNWPDSEFTAEELVVACWQKFPNSFGLQGFSDKYPDSNVIYRYIMGKESIVKKRRWMLQKDQKRYELTIAGINHAMKLIDASGTKKELQQYRVDRFYEKLLFRAFTGSAWNKFKNNKLKDLTFTDACGFWSINPRSSGEQYRSARYNLEKAIFIAKEYLDKVNPNISLASKITISMQDVENLETLEEELEVKFRDQLDLISHRSMKWGRVVRDEREV